MRKHIALLGVLCLALSVALTVGVGSAKASLLPPCGVENDGFGWEGLTGITQGQSVTTHPVEVAAATGYGEERTSVNLESADCTDNLQAGIRDLSNGGSPQAYIEYDGTIKASVRPNLATTKPPSGHG